MPKIRNLLRVRHHPAPTSTPQQVKPFGSLWMDPETELVYAVTNGGNAQGLVVVKGQTAPPPGRATFTRVGNIAALDSTVGTRLVPWTRARDV